MRLRLVAKDRVPPNRDCSESIWMVEVFLSEHRVISTSWS